MKTKTHQHIEFESHTPHLQNENNPISNDNY